MNLFFKKNSSPEEIEKQKKALELEIEMNLSSIADLGKAYFFNLYFNLSHLNNCYNLKPCHQMMKNIPAIICGAGASLEQNFSSLKGLSEKALIFSTGTAMTNMTKKDVFYHFGVGIDPNSPKRVQSHIEAAPLFCTTSYASDNFISYPYKKILTGGSGELPWEEYVDQTIDLNLVKVDYGYNVTTLAIAIAHFLGCSPIILVGVDLCYENNKYSGGIEEKNTYETIKTRDQNNKKVLTQKDWLLVKIWLERFEEKYPKVLFNASNGLLLEKVSKGSLKEFFFDPMPSKNMQKMILNTCSKIFLDEKKLSSFFEKQYQDLIHIQKTINETGFEQITLETFEKIPFYQLFFIPFWTIFQGSFSSLMPSNLSIEEKKIHIKAQKIAFLKQVLRTHIPLFKEFLKK